MPGDKMKSIKGGKSGDKQYEALRDQGMSKEKAAAITNASQKGKKK